jgi:trehalose 6-phosphate synthase
MNLVAKEYVAAQDPKDPGVLILSRFAGAVVDGKRALLVNPYEAESVANAIAQALAMPLDERRERHAALLQGIIENDRTASGCAAMVSPALTGPSSVADA